MYNSNTFRKWILTINNPDEQGYSISALLDKLQSIKGDSVYYCFCDVNGCETNTHHIHIFIFCETGVRFSTIERLFHGANFMAGRGSAQDFREYIFKHCINPYDTFVECGICPVEESCSFVSVRHCRREHGK